MRDPHVTTKERDEAAIEEACKLLRPLTTPARSRSVVNWDDPDASNDPRDLFEAAVEFVIALLDPDPPSTGQPETYDSQAQQAANEFWGVYDSQAQQAADEFLGVHASIVRKVVLPALRLGCPPERRGPRRGGNLLRDRWIAVVVTTICKWHELDPYRNPLSEHPCGCSVVAEALRRLGIELAESSVEEIYRKNKQV
jgi:hypothetical protein